MNASSVGGKRGLGDLGACSLGKILKKIGALRCLLAHFHAV